MHSVLRFFLPTNPAAQVQPRAQFFRRWTRRGAVLLALASAALWADPGSGAPKKAYQVSAGDAVATLKQFAEQTGGQIVYLTDMVRGVQTHAVAGELTARQTLEQMLAGTGLQVVEDQKTGALTVRRAPAAK